MPSTHRYPLTHCTASAASVHCLPPTLDTAGRQQHCLEKITTPATPTVAVAVAVTPAALPPARPPCATSALCQAQLAAARFCSRFCVRTGHAPASTSACATTVLASESAERSILKRLQQSDDTRFCAALPTGARVLDHDNIALSGHAAPLGLARPEPIRLQRKLRPLVSCEPATSNHHPHDVARSLCNAAVRLRQRAAA